MGSIASWFDLTALWRAGEKVAAFFRRVLELYTKNHVIFVLWVHRTVSATHSTALAHQPVVLSLVAGGQDPHQVDSARGHRLPQVHLGQRRLELRHRHVGGDVLRGEALLGHVQPRCECPAELPLPVPSPCLHLVLRCLLMCFCGSCYVAVRWLFQAFKTIPWLVDSCFLREPLWN